MRVINTFAVALSIQMAAIGAVSAGELRLASADPAHTSVAATGFDQVRSREAAPAFAKIPAKHVNRRMSRLAPRNEPVRTAPKVAEAKPAKGCFSLACHDFVLIGVGF